MHSWACPCQGPTPGAGWMPPRCPGGSGNSPDYYLYHFQQVLLKEFCSKMHSWACPCRGPTPGAGWTPPRCPGGSGNSPDCYLYHFQQVLYMWSHIESQCEPPWAFEAIIFIAMIWIFPPKVQTPKKKTNQKWVTTWCCCWEDSVI